MDRHRGEGYKRTVWTEILYSTIAAGQGLTSGCTARGGGEEEEED